MPAFTPTILLVEDNEEDAFLLRRAFRNAQVSCVLHEADDGQLAVEYLGGTGRFADRAAFPFPDLVLLDLKLPYVHGFEVLEWMATQPSCKNLPVIVLTSSGEERDQNRAAEFNVRGYYTKPPTRELVDAVNRALQEIETAAAERERGSRSA